MSTALTIYSTPQCPFCALLRDFLNSKQIAFTDIDISRDVDAAQRMISLSGQMGVPVIVIPQDLATSHKEEIVIGFHQDALSQLLGL